MTTLTDVLDFISTKANQDDIERIWEFANKRTHALRDIRSANVRQGSLIRLVNISPKYMAGLSGRVDMIRGKTATVTLDKASTRELKRQRQNRFYIPPDCEEFTLQVHLSTCEVVL